MNWLNRRQDMLRIHARINAALKAILSSRIISRMSLIGSYRLWKLSSRTVVMLSTYFIAVRADVINLLNPSSSSNACFSIISVIATK
jgi:hypothetical protein